MDHLSQIVAGVGVAYLLGRGDSGLSVNHSYWKVSGCGGDNDRKGR